MTDNPQLAQLFLARARQDLIERYWPQLRACVNSLTEEQLWWRPNQASNSVGNLVLHLNGNIRQWIVATFTGTAFARDRAREFSERGPVPVADLLGGLAATLEEADKVMARLTPEELAATHVIFGNSVSGLEAIFHTVSHFTLHYGQIAYIAKSQLNRELGFGLALNPAQAK